MAFLRTVLLVLLIAAPVAADTGPERITNWKSLIRIAPDATVTVTENITVNCRGEQIERGIVREFPTTYTDHYSRKVRVRFDIVEVLRNGALEPYHLEEGMNGILVYIGEKSRRIDHGLHTYTLTYITDRQIGYFDGFDELYWNVTGTGWRLGIDHAEAEVELPDGARLLEHAGYTGPQDATGHDFRATVVTDRLVSFVTTRPLMPFEGLTVVASWPKGFVHQPTRREQLGFLVKDNTAAMAGLAWLGFLILYFLAAWLAVGRDPRGGTIIPLFEPPRGLSPAGLRFVRKMGFDHKTFAAAVVGLAVKGWLTIKEKGSKFTLRKVHGSGSVPLSRGETKLMETLFKGRSAVVLKKTNHKRIKEAMTALKKSLQNECEKVYFVTNRVFFFPGLVFTLLAVLTIVLTPPVQPQAIFLAVWLSFWTLGVFAIAWKVWRNLRDAFTQREGRTGALAQALVTGLFLLPFLGGEVAGMVLLAMALSPAATTVLGALLLLPVVFYQLLKAPTTVGRRLMDRIEGFRRYLSVAEKERLEFLHPPDHTPELFEKYLPHAMALGVENEWSRQFETVLAAGATEERSWSPSWYSGRSWRGLDTSGFATSLGSSFSGAIASSSTAPGSSSGSGGGGSSGGGGGGGGGGGW